MLRCPRSHSCEPTPTILTRGQSHGDRKGEAAAPQQHQDPETKTRAQSRGRGASPIPPPQPSPGGREGLSPESGPGGGGEAPRCRRASPTGAPLDGGTRPRRPRQPQPPHRGGTARPRTTRPVPRTQEKPPNFPSRPATGPHRDITASQGNARGVIRTSPPQLIADRWSHACS